MKNQTDKERLSKRDIILNESFRLFLKKGYAAVSFSDLVEAANVSRGNMFHHFKNKEDIFHHVVDLFVFEFLNDDAPNLLELTSSTPLKGLHRQLCGKHRSPYGIIFMTTKDTVTSANFMSFILYLKDNHLNWKEKFQEYEGRNDSEWNEVVEISKQKGEFVQIVETEKILLVVPESGRFSYGTALFSVS